MYVCPIHLNFFFHIRIFSYLRSNFWVKFFSFFSTVSFCYYKLQPLYCIVLYKFFFFFEQFSALVVIIIVQIILVCLFPWKKHLYNTNERISFQFFTIIQTYIIQNWNVVVIYHEWHMNMYSLWVKKCFHVKMLLSEKIAIKKKYDYCCFSG